MDRHGEAMPGSGGVFDTATLIEQHLHTGLSS